MSICTVRNDSKFRRLLTDVFSDDFMQQHTKFSDFEVFCFSSAVIVNWKADPMIYNEELLDRFVRESTEFPDWETMVCSAVDERFHRTQ